MTTHIVVGIDGGGTCTRVAIATGAGKVLGWGEAGPGNYHDVGIDEVRANIQQACTQAWHMAHSPPRRADACFLGLGSIASEHDRDVIRRLARDLSLATDEHVGVDHDLRIALAGGLGGQPGIVLIAGTGSSSYGRSVTGESWRAGGWGPLLDDIGSGGWLGLQAMVAAVRDADGRGVPTLLRERVLSALNLDDMQRILHRVHAQGMTRQEMAALAPLVMQAAAEHDAAAIDIITRGARELAVMIATVQQKLSLSDQQGKVPVAVTGGLTRAGDIWRAPLQTAVEQFAPACVLVEPRLPSVLGAVLLALQSLGIQPTEKVIAQLRQFAPAERPS